MSDQRQLRKYATCNDNESSSRKRPRKSGEEQSELRYVELYAGVGGWTMALQKAAPDGVKLTCCAALDHSDLSINVYRHNFGDVPKTVRIEQLRVEDLIEWKADVWMMSPPCQPHTRQHSNQQSDLQDSRSNSFLHICDLLTKMPSACLPSLILLENVVGFESSHSFRLWKTSLHNASYALSHFHLQPTQVGLPNNRPRYYCVAVQRSSLSNHRNSEWRIGRYFSTDSAQMAGTDGPLIFASLPEFDVVPEETVDRERLPRVGTFLDNTTGDVSRLCIPDKLLDRPASWCLDIVNAESRRTSCFTSAYGKYFKGTGSVLVYEADDSAERRRMPRFELLPPEDREYNADWLAPIRRNGYALRYFSGTELARLFGFSETFAFPSGVTPKQQWKLIGNSLNVRMASRIVKLGLVAAGLIDM